MPMIWLAHGCTTHTDGSDPIYTSPAAAATGSAAAATLGSSRITLFC
jgi:hypothetical protein